MRTAHQIASGFDRAGLSLAGVAAGCLADARQRQADAAGKCGIDLPSKLPDSVMS